jgi:hypothetical protein
MFIRHLDNPVKWAARRTERVDPAFDFGVIHERRGVVWFDAGVDDEGASTTPVLLNANGINAMNVGCGIGTSEHDPEPIV